MSHSFHGFYCSADIFDGTVFNVFLKIGGLYSKMCFEKKNMDMPMFFL